MQKRELIAVPFVMVLAVFLLLSVLLMHPFGAPDKSAMDDHIITHTQEETGTNNGVTSIVFDYRGFDTLGEATILFTAVAAVLMIFRRVKP